MYHTAFALIFETGSFILWTCILTHDSSIVLRSPDTSKVRSKMIYASSKDRFKRELDGIQVELQATDPTEMGLDVIRSRSGSG